jgi:hypothetical protein
MKRRKKLIIQECEVCGEKDTSVLELHHIVPRTDSNTNNDPYNLAIICANCHSKNHRGNLKIIGIYPSTKLPNGRTLIYELEGINEAGIDKPYYVPVNESTRIRNG